MLAIKGALIKTVTHGDLENKVLLIEKSKIKGIVDSTEIPPNAKVIDASGKVITPGLIDVHTHLGLLEEGYPISEGSLNEMTDPITPHLRVIDAINPDDFAFKEAVKGGVTCVQVLPGSANIVGGLGAVIKTRGNVIDEMLVKEPSGLKVALGENPKRIYKEQKKMPSTRMASAALLRETLIGAENYSKKKEKATRDLKKEAVLKALERKIPLRVHAHRADDIVTALRIAKEFNLEITLEHCTEGEKIVDILKENKVHTAIGPTLSTRLKLELRNLSWRTVVELNNAGVKTAIITDHPEIPIQYLIVCAALAIREGLKEEDALAAITINAAEHLGVENRVGSIEVGKDADLVIWSGDPFDYRTKVEMTFIEGEAVYKSCGQEG